MKYLKGFEVNRWWRIGRLLYAETPYNTFNYSESVANKIFWRFYWLKPNKERRRLDDLYTGVEKIYYVVLCFVAVIIFNWLGNVGV